MKYAAFYLCILFLLIPGRADAQWNCFAWLWGGPNQETTYSPPLMFGNGSNLVAGPVRSGFDRPPYPIIGANPGLQTQPVTQQGQQGVVIGQTPTQAPTTFQVVPQQAVQAPPHISPVPMPCTPNIPNLAMSTPMPMPCVGTMSHVTHQVGYPVTFAHTRAGDAVSLNTGPPRISPIPPGGPSAVARVSTQIIEAPPAPQEVLTPPLRRPPPPYDGF